MTQDNPSARRGRTLALVAALALVSGIAAGAAGIYVMETGAGNELAAAVGLGTGGSGRCPLDDAARAALDKAARGEVAAVQALDAPVDVASLAFDDEAGAKKTLADFSGKALLVNLWATWCVPCRQEMPALDALERQKGDGRFAVLPINIDMGGPDKPKAFYAETNLTALPFLRDASMGVFNTLKGEGLAVGLPTTLLVDETGCARAAISGPAEWASPDALTLIEVLKQQVAAPKA
ncbi:thiol:disulfide interchange protein TlpA [Mangrovicella endophytica]|uniref:thiol:disulfide interchange protein TlpA n=1 Tax=Mangrovicella endophytica TaxID=2066697 RepID=UPI001FE20BB3|nr:TlpA disulfide reductase family protein [Mangrovicella endophytica]